MSTVDIHEFGIDCSTFCAVLVHKKTGLRYVTPEYSRDTLREYLAELVSSLGNIMDLEQWYNAKKFAIDYYRTGESAGFGLEKIKKA